MSLDVLDLRAFYANALGQFAAKVVGKTLQKAWPSMKGADISILGYGVPFIASWYKEAERLINLMPESQGVAYWPEEGANLSCLVHLDDLPLADEAVNRVLLIHALENAADPEAVLDEVWRTLKPQGQLMVVVPHRRGAWAHSDTTPFGTGQPYSRKQLHELLIQRRFSIEETSRALIAPPRFGLIGLVLAPYIEACGCVFSRFGGVLIVRATKQVYTPAYIKSRSTSRRLVLPMPVSAKPLPTGRGYSHF